MGTSNWNSSPFCFRWKTCCLSPETYSISFKLDADFAGKSKFKKHVFQKVLGERKCYQKCCPFGCIRLLRSKVRMENWTPTKGHYLCYTLFYWHLVMPRLCKDHVEHCSVLNKFSEHSAVNVQVPTVPFFRVLLPVPFPRIEDKDFPVRQWVGSHLPSGVKKKRCIHNHIYVCMCILISFMYVCLWHIFPLLGCKPKHPSLPIMLKQCLAKYQISTQ